jgi:uridine kinase
MNLAFAAHPTNKTCLLRSRPADAAPFLGTADAHKQQVAVLSSEGAFALVMIAGTRESGWIKRQYLTPVAAAAAAAAAAVPVAPSRVVIVGICGPSGCGKSRLAATLALCLNSPCAAISLDWFFDPAKMPKAVDGNGLNWETPAGIDATALEQLLRSTAAALGAGQAPPSVVATPKKGVKSIAGYASAVAANRSNTVFLIVEGFLLFAFSNIAALCDVRIFLDTSQAVCRARRFGRDGHKWGNNQAAFTQWYDAVVWPHYQQYLPAQHANAQQVPPAMAGGAPLPVIRINADGDEAAVQTAARRLVDAALLSAAAPANGSAAPALLPAQPPAVLCTRCGQQHAEPYYRCPQRCKAPDCTETHTSHHCNVCGKSNADHRAWACPAIGGGGGCKATGCNEQHAQHRCGSCGSTDADHKSQNCPAPVVRTSVCGAATCRENHTHHVCRVCGNPSADHRSAHCPGAVVAYHQTDLRSATLILSGRTMLPGTVGAAGPGIYFATSPLDTCHKAHRKGFLLEVSLNLGNSMQMPHAGDASMTEAKGRAAGYDSITFLRNGGTEYVLWDFSRASIRSVYPCDPATGARSHQLAFVCAKCNKVHPASHFDANDPTDATGHC